MALVKISYTTRMILPSCKAGEQELSAGEEVIIELKPKNALWPASIKATVVGVKPTNKGRVYTFEYDNVILGGAPEPEICDVTEIRCYSCCDAIREELLTSGVTGLPPAKIVAWVQNELDPVQLPYPVFLTPVWAEDGSSTVVFPSRELVGVNYNITLQYTNGVISFTSPIGVPSPTILAILKNILA